MSDVFGAPFVNCLIEATRSRANKNLMKTAADTIKVAIIEEPAVLREGLAFLVDSTGGLRCTGSFGSVEQALRRIGDDLPHVVLIDIGLPGISGI